MNTAAKMALLAAFILRPCHWDAQAEEWCRRLPHDSPEDYGRHFSALVTSGRAQALELRGPAGRVGVLVYEIEPACSEFVVLGAISEDNHRQITTEFFPEIEAHARAMGCRVVRFHTMRPGLVQKAKEAGFRMCEIVMRKDVSA